MFEAYAEWGCQGIDLWNALRTKHYVNVAKMGAPGDWIGDDCIPAGVASLLGNPTYTTPAADGAWWYDPNRPESAGFAGMLVNAITGMYSGDWASTITESLGRSGRVAVLQGGETERTITVEAELYGTSCCSVSYGFRVLMQALRGCCVDPCCGQPLRVPAYLLGSELACQGFSPVGSLIAEPEPWRTLFGLGLTEGPEIIDGTGPRCGLCGCWPQTSIRFVLTATNPGLYTDPTLLSIEPVLIHDADAPVLCDICQQDETACPDPFAPLIDPLCVGLPAPPVPPSTIAPNCFCAPIGFKRKVFEIDTGASRWFNVLLNFELRTGAQDLRNMRVRMWQKVGIKDMDSGFYTACNACTGFQLGFAPANGRVQLDSRIGSVEVISGGRTFDGSGQVFTVDGLPWDGQIRMACGKYLVAIDTDPYSTAGDASIRLSTVEVEP